LKDKKVLQQIDGFLEYIRESEEKAANKIIANGQIKMTKKTNSGKYNFHVTANKKFKVSFDFNYYVFFCDCSKVTDCNHIFAAMKYLKGVLSEDTKIKKELPSKTLPKIVSKVNEPTAKVLPKPVDHGYNLLVKNVSSKGPEAYKFKRLNNWYSDSIMVETLIYDIEDGLSFECTPRNRYYSTAEFKFNIKYVNNHLYGKCEICNSSDYNRKCIHIGDIYRYDFVVKETQNLVEGNQIDFKMFKETSDLDESVLLEKFYIRKHTSTNYSLVSKKGNYFNKASQILEEYQFEGQDLAVMESKLLFDSALVWNLKGPFTGVNGKMSKTGDKLVSNFESISYEHFFSPIDYGLFKLLKIANLRTKDDLREAHNLIVTELGTLSEWRHFVNMDVHMDIRRSTLESFNLSKELLKLKVNIREDRGFVIFDFTFVAGDIEYRPSQISWRNPFLFYFGNGVGYVLNSLEIYDLINTTRNKDSIELLQSNSSEVIRLITRLERFAMVEQQILQKTFLTNGVKQLFIKQTGSFILFEPKLKYGEITFGVLSRDTKVDGDVEKLPSESEILEYRDYFKTLHPEWNLLYFSRPYVFLDQKKVTNKQWFIGFFKSCLEEGIEIFGQEVISTIKYNFNKPSINKSIKSGIDWFEMRVDLKFGDLTVKQKNWIDAINSGERYVKLDDGTVGMLPEEWMQDLKSLLRYSDGLEKKDLRISKFKFHLIEELFGKIDDEIILEEIQAKKKALEGYEKDKKYTLPKEVVAKLRPYQNIGFQWLKFLDEFNFGGILADDMGLGKTLQMILFLQDQKNSSKGTSLVVVPKTLLFNWQVELDKFASGLKYMVYHGLNRIKEVSTFKEYDVIITTYDTVSRDIEEVRKFKFNYCILDESQAIKNISSIRYKSVRLLVCRNRFVMTGTPIENNTFDLYAQFSFVNPGILGNDMWFAKNYAVPIDQHGDAEAATMLKKLIHPFILRRTKELVAKDLPEKMESIIYCEMGDNQRKLYNGLKEKIKKDVEESIEADGLNQSKFLILEGLTKLRQMCNSPQLIFKDETSANSSIKIETLVSLLEEELGNHKALVYSQFVTMLSLVRKELDKKGIKYAYLDGSTRDRGKSVADFMDDDDCHVFLLSLKAGNAGLNLTKADYVYIIDPWWNPAVEAQAIDRTHRIGQKNNVFAYKMICKDSIEEKILELQRKKKKLAGDLINVDESVFKSLDKKELLSLFD
jgi:hypothetical protein